MMTKRQLDRLQKLHDFVKTNIKPKQFDMRHYRAERDGKGEEVEGVCHYEIHLDDIESNDKHKCGTVGCLMGWAPWVFTKELKRAKLLGKNRETNFNNIARMLFGIDSGQDVWKYLFDSEWASNPDNWDTLKPNIQKKEALRRIKHVIENKGRLTTHMYREMRERGI